MTTIELTKAETSETREAFDFEAAQKEGWTIADCGVYADGGSHVELQKIDNPETGERTFGEDRYAWEHVITRAREGSPLHIQALDMIDRRERLAIETHCGTW